jgi:hypothetical protein
MEINIEEHVKLEDTLEASQKCPYSRGVLLSESN